MQLYTVSLHDALPILNEEFASDEYANLGSVKPDEFETLAELQPEVIMIHGRQSNTQTIDEMKAAAPDAEIVFVAADSNNYFQDRSEEHTSELQSRFDL